MLFCISHLIKNSIASKKYDIAENIANCICKPIDFEKVINQSYSDGGRIYIGMDGGELCKDWIEDNLAGKPALVLPLKKNGLDLRSSIKYLVAKLISNGIDIDIGKLYGLESQDSQSGDKDKKDNEDNEGKRKKKNKTQSC